MIERAGEWKMDAHHHIMAIPNGERGEGSRQMFICLLDMDAHNAQEE